jgi:predicted nucleotidyltransferase
MNAEVTILRAAPRHDLRDLARRAAPILERAGARRAVAFGSYARGDADAWSDLDLVVVLETDLPPLERAALLSDLFDAIPIGLDLLVYTPEEFRRGIERGLGVFERLEREGVTIHG